MIVITPDFHYKIILDGQVHINDILSISTEIRNLNKCQ